MNERIRELAVETGWSEDIRYAPRAKEIEKFAELIVRECLTFVDPMPGSGDIDDLALQGVYNKIKEHFGVRE